MWVKPEFGYPFFISSSAHCTTKIHIQFEARLALKSILATTNICTKYLSTSFYKGYARLPSLPHSARSSCILLWHLARLRISKYLPHCIYIQSLVRRYWLELVKNFQIWPFEAFQWWLNAKFSSAVQPRRTAYILRLWK